MSAFEQWAAVQGGASLWRLTRGRPTKLSRVSKTVRGRPYFLPSPYCLLSGCTVYLACVGGYALADLDTEYEAAVTGLRFPCVFFPASSRCKGVVKRLGAKLASAEEEALACSSTWEKEKWSKRLLCSSKLADLQCAASLGLYSVFESGRELWSVAGP